VRGGKAPQPQRPPCHARPTAKVALDGLFVPALGLHGCNAAPHDPDIEHHPAIDTLPQKLNDGAVRRAGLGFAGSRDELRPPAANPLDPVKRIG